MITNIFPTKKQSTTYHLNEQKLKDLSSLLACGYPVIDCFDLLQWDCEHLKEKLEQGEDVKKILIEGQKGRIYEHLDFFINILPLEQAIDCSLTMMKFEKGLAQKLVKKATYPLCILIFAFGMLLFFSNSIIPMMMESFTQDQSFSFLNQCVQIIQYLCQISVFILLLILLSMFLLIRIHSLRLQVFFHFHNRLKLIKEYISYQFAGYLLQLEKGGISTIDAIAYLRELKKDTLLFDFIKCIETELQNGKDFIQCLEESAFLSSSLCQTIRMGILTTTCEKVLPNYLQQQELHWERKIKHIGIILQCIAYTFVAVLVLLVYQIMLIPLSMLEQM